MRHVMVQMGCGLEVVGPNCLISMLWRHTGHIHCSIAASKVYCQHIVKLFTSVLIQIAMQGLLEPEGSQCSTLVMTVIVIDSYNVCRSTSSANDDGG